MTSTTPGTTSPPNPASFLSPTMQGLILVFTFGPFVVTLFLLLFHPILAGPLGQLGRFTQPLGFGW